jgi:sugar O-acyltransferase (sialic acid O-acetyltransferase NeuD family)
MTSTQNLIVFGTGSFGEVAAFYFDHDSDYDTVAFTADSEYVKTDTFRGRPLVEFATVAEEFSPSTHDLFVAIGDNGLRAEKCREARKKGYDLASYVCSQVTKWGEIDVGPNSFVFEDQTIQPFVDIGENVVLWSGNHIGHHSTIGDHCFITSHVVVSGHTVVEPHAYLGVNATLVDAITVGRGCTVGAGAVVINDTEPNSTYVGNPAEPL